MTLRGENLWYAATLIRGSAAFHPHVGLRSICRWSYVQPDWSYVHAPALRSTADNTSTPSLRRHISPPAASCHAHPRQRFVRRSILTSDLGPSVAGLTSNPIGHMSMHRPSDAALRSTAGNTSTPSLRRHISPPAASCHAHPRQRLLRRSILTSDLGISVVFLCREVVAFETACCAGQFIGSCACCALLCVVSGALRGLVVVSMLHCPFRRCLVLGALRRRFPLSSGMSELVERRRRMEVLLLQALWLAPQVPIPRSRSIPLVAARRRSLRRR